MISYPILSSDSKSLSNPGTADVAELYNVALTIRHVLPVTSRSCPSCPMATGLVHRDYTVQQPFKEGYIRSAISHQARPPKIPPAMITLPFGTSSAYTDSFPAPPPKQITINAETCFNVLQFRGMSIFIDD